MLASIIRLVRLMKSRPNERNTYMVIVSIVAIVAIFLMVFQSVGVRKTGEGMEFMGYDDEGNEIWDWVDDEPYWKEIDNPGCTDAEADNYDDLATKDDGSCTHPEPFSDDLSGDLRFPQPPPDPTDPFGLGMGGLDGQPTCDDPNALNYGDSGECRYLTLDFQDNADLPDVGGLSVGPDWDNPTENPPSYPIYGCTDSIAANYNPSATHEREPSDCEYLTLDFPAGADLPVGGPFDPVYEAPEFEPNLPHLWEQDPDHDDYELPETPEEHWYDCLGGDAERGIGWCDIDENQFIWGCIDLDDLGACIGWGWRY